jgi:hypothetical protein
VQYWAIIIKLYTDFVKYIVYNSLNNSSGANIVIS